MRKIIMPVIDTESGDYDYKGRKLTREEIGDMEYEHFVETNAHVMRFTENMRRGISNYEIGLTGRFRDADNSHHPDILYNFEEIEAIVLDSQRNEIKDGFFEQYVKSGKMFILIMNFNPDEMSGDAKSEMKFWGRDSKMVLNDMSITEELQLKTLPVRHFWIEDGENRVLITGCKIVQIFSDKKNPFYFGIIVEKATYDNGKQ